MRMVIIVRQNLFILLLYFVEYVCSYYCYANTVLIYQISDYSGCRLLASGGYIRNDNIIIFLLPRDQKNSARNRTLTKSPANVINVL